MTSPSRPAAPHSRAQALLLATAAAELLRLPGVPTELTEAAGGLPPRLSTPADVAALRDGVTVRGLGPACDVYELADGVLSFLDGGVAHLDDAAGWLLHLAHILLDRGVSDTRVALLGDVDVPAVGAAELALRLLTVAERLDPDSAGC